MNPWRCARACATAPQHPGTPWVGAWAGARREGHSVPVFAVPLASAAGPVPGPAPGAGCRFSAASRPDLGPGPGPAHGSRGIQCRFSLYLWRRPRARSRPGRRLQVFRRRLHLTSDRGPGRVRSQRGARSRPRHRRPGEASPQPRQAAMGVPGRPPSTAAEDDRNTFVNQNCYTSAKNSEHTEHEWKQAQRDVFYDLSLHSHADRRQRVKLKEISQVIDFCASLTTGDRFKFFFDPSWVSALTGAVFVWRGLEFAGNLCFTFD